MRRNPQSQADALTYDDATLEHIVLAPKCYGGMFDVGSPFVSKVDLFPTVLELLHVEDPKITPRDVRHPVHSHRQWPIGVRRCLTFSLTLCYLQDKRPARVPVGLYSPTGFALSPPMNHPEHPRTRKSIARDR